MGCERRLRLVVGGRVVRLAAVVCAAVMPRRQDGRSLHGGSRLGWWLGWWLRWRWLGVTVGGTGRRTVRRFGGAAVGWLLWLEGGGARPSSLGLEAFSCSARAWLGPGSRF